ncbi:hypothetical protein BX600DRAFT_433556 [Xylariales sp. PMI_506]|nr:hypothetical protein BX600DRAFT_433556 [Xylariales sp. PMI_506]
MIVLLHYVSTSSLVPSRSNTAADMPNSSHCLPSQVNYREQILANCRFICPERDTVEVITTSNPSGQWKAIALQINKDGCEPLIISDSCENIHKALESLHNKSGEATDLFIRNNGYKHPKDNVISLDFDDDSDDSASIASDQSIASSNVLSVYESSDSDDLSTIAPPPKTRKNRRKSRNHPLRKDKLDALGGRVSSKPLRPAPKPVVVRHSASFPGPPHAPPYRAPPGVPVHPTGVLPVYHSTPPLPPAVPGPPNPPGPPIPLAPPGVRTVGVTGPSAKAHDVRLTIRWLYHSEQRILESSRPSLRALQEIALTWVRGHMGSFENVTAADRAPNRAWMLRAVIKQAFFGPESYDMSSYRGDDLTRIFSIVGRNDIPRFVIEVDYTRPMPAGPINMPTPPPPPPPAYNTVPTS